MFYQPIYKRPGSWGRRCGRRNVNRRSAIVRAAARLVVVLCDASVRCLLIGIIVIIVLAQNCGRRRAAGDAGGLRLGIGVLRLLIKRILQSL